MLGWFHNKHQSAPRVCAVIAAAGAGQRMGGIDKQQLLLGDIPVVVRSIAAYNDCPRITDIVVVCRREDIADYYNMVRDFALDKVRRVVTGGQERQDSVQAGIDAAPEETQYFAIHDGARPLVIAALIENCLDAAMEHGAAALGVPIKDTVKVRDADGMIEATLDRARLWGMQTPQIFEADAYRRALAQAQSAGHSYTDDCQLMEQAGHGVYIAMGSYENIKITTPEDIALAYGILAQREGALPLA